MGVNEIRFSGAADNICSIDGACQSSETKYPLVEAFLIAYTHPSWRPKAEELEGNGETDEEILLKFIQIVAKSILNNKGDEQLKRTEFFIRTIVQLGDRLTPDGRSISYQLTEQLLQKQDIWKLFHEYKAKGYNDKQIVLAGLASSAQKISINEGDRTIGQEALDFLQLISSIDLAQGPYIGADYICFDSQIYNRAVIDLNKSGFLFNNDAKSVVGQFQCVQNRSLIYPDTVPAEQVASLGVSFWVDDNARAHRMIDKLPEGVMVLLGTKDFSIYNSKKANEALTDGLRVLYRCEAVNDRDCVYRIINDLEQAALENGVVTKEALNKIRENRYDRAMGLGRLIWRKSALLLVLAKEQDEYAGGIDEYDLIPIYKKGMAEIPKESPKTAEAAERYRDHAFDILKNMISFYSGYQTILEREQDFGCTTDWSYSWPDCGSGYDAYASKYLNLKCKDIHDFDVLISEGGCTREKPQREPVDRSWR